MGKVRRGYDPAHAVAERFEPFCPDSPFCVLLGSGGMGEVYLASIRDLPRRDALKASSAGLVGQTMNTEPGSSGRADLASTLWHAHIVGVA